MKIFEYKNIDEAFFQNIKFETINSVNEIIKNVKEKKDSAVIEYTKKFDGHIENIEVTKQEIEMHIKMLMNKL